MKNREALKSVRKELPRPTMIEVNPKKAWVAQEEIGMYYCGVCLKTVPFVDNECTMCFNQPKD